MTSPFLANAYITDILDQPQALNRTLAAFARSGFDEVLRFAAQLKSGALRRVVLTGMGSSYHAFHPLLLGLIRRGIQAQMIETSELIHHATGLIAADALIVLASQSGRSAEVLQLLERAAPGMALIGITNTADSPLAARAATTLLTEAGAEYSVSCKTYVSALVALAVLEKLLAGEEVQPVLADLQSLPEAVAGYLSGLEEHVGSIRRRLEEVQYLVLAGRGSSLAAAGTGGLIIKEAAHFPAEGMSCAAFRHGPMEMVSPAAYFMVYEGLGETVALNADLVADIQKAGGRAALVGCDPAGDVFHLPPTSAAGLPVLEILPAQMLSLGLALQHGHIPGEFSLGSKVTSVE
jgi:glucosamine--fructose-6-phosphate aminotransferase (isomerizing)